MPSFQNDECIHENTRILHRKLFVLLQIQAKKKLDWNILLSVSSTLHTFILRIFSAREALPQQKLHFIQSLASVFVKYTVRPLECDYVTM